MKILRERPSQRLHHRVTAPLWVTWRDATARAADWSLSGLRLEGLSTAGLAVGDETNLTICLPFQGFDVRFTAGAEIVRLGEDMAAFRFTQLGDRERGLMEHFIEELVRGSMVEVADTIQRIDVPVTPVSTKPDPNPKTVVPVRRWPIRAVVMTTLYLTLGICILGYAGLVGYAHFFKLEVDAAVVASPIEVVSAHSDGRILLAEIAPGDRITAGQTLGRLADSALDHRLDLAVIAVERAHARRDFAARRLEAVGLGTRDRDVVADNNRDRTAALVTALETRLDLARSRHERLDGIYRQGWTTITEVEAAADTVAALEAELAVLRIDLGEYDETATETTADSLYDFVRMEQDQADLAAELLLAEDELVLARQELAALEAHRRRLELVAPFDGKVVDIHHPAGAGVLRGEDILTIERDEARTVEAFLSQAEILSVGLGDPATIYLAALGRRVQANVARIDRTTGSIDEQRGRYSWRGPDDRTGRVVLAFADAAVATDIDAGLPAIIIFDRRNDNGVLDGVFARVGGWFATPAQAGEPSP